MIVVLGASGYIGEAFVRELQRRGEPFLPISRSQFDYAHFETLLSFLREKKPEFLINTAGFTGRPNVDACETAKADTLAGCVLLPQIIAHACVVAGIPWGHVSSGCLYSGAKIVEGGKVRVEKDMTRPEMRTLIEKESRGHPRFHRGGRAEFFISRTAHEFLQRLEGDGRGSDWRRGTKL